MRESQLEELQSQFNGCLRDKLKLSPAVVNEMMQLDSARLGLGVMDVKGAYYATKVTELAVKLNDPTVVGHIARHRLSRFQKKLGCSQNPFQYEELEQYNEKTQGANKLYVDAAYLSAHRTGIRIVEGDGAAAQVNKLTIVEVAEKINHDE
jgi:hypothetical protein